MGYTHYFTAGLNKGLLADIKAIVENSPVTLAGPHGMGKPVITANEVVFNGVRELGEDVETFAIENEVADDFCKTNYSPYDVVVVAVLTAVVANDAGTVASDGAFGDWEEGIALYERTCGELGDTNVNKLKRFLA